MNIKISPSLMCMDLLNVQNQIDVLNKKSSYLHIDIIDGHYAKNFGLSPDFIGQLSKITKIPIDVHLMVDGLNLDLIEQCIEAGASMITLQADLIEKKAFTLITRIKQLGKKVGISINPATPLEAIKLYIDLIDKITIMAVDPGFSGQRFVDASLVKIEQARDLKKEYGYMYEIEVDGACNEMTFGKLNKAGAEVLVLGSTGLFSLDNDLNNAWGIMEDNIYKSTKQKI